MKRSANCICLGPPSWVFSLPKLEDDIVLELELPDAGRTRRSRTYYQRAPLRHIQELAPRYQLKRSANCICRELPSVPVSLPKLEDTSVLLLEFPELEPGSNRTEFVRL